MNTPKFGKMDQTKIVFISMILLILILLSMTIFYFVLRGKRNKEEVTPTPGPQATFTPALTNTTAPKATSAPVTETATPTPGIQWEATDTPAPTSKPTNTPTNKPTNTPTARPTATSAPAATSTPKPTQAVKETPEITGIDNAAVKRQAEAYLSELTNNYSTWAMSSKDVKVSTQVYKTTAYTSVLFSCTSQNMTKPHLEPHVFLNTTGEEVKGKDVFKESYFAILKERLQEAAVVADSSFKGSYFVTADCPYAAADFNRFYIHDKKVSFVFNANSLGGVNHREFTFDVALSEAELFMNVDTKGNKVGFEIRTNLNPDKKMICLTFNDGPYNTVEAELLEVMKKYNALCTFFPIGNRVETSQKSLQSLITLAKAGHEIGATAYSGKTYKTEDVNKADFWGDINKENLLLANSIGYVPSIIRMGGGKDKLAFMSRVPQPMINWSIDPQDWKGGVVREGKVTEEEWAAQVKRVSDTVVEKAADGKIVLLSSLYMTTADAVEEIMAQLTKQGYQFVTVSEMFYYKGIELENGTVSSSSAKYNTEYGPKG